MRTGRFFGVYRKGITASGRPVLEISTVKLATNLGRVLFLVTVATATSMTFGQASKKGAEAGVPDWGQFRGPKRDGSNADKGGFEHANAPQLSCLLSAGEFRRDCSSPRLGSTLPP